MENALSTGPLAAAAWLIAAAALTAAAGFAWLLRSHAARLRDSEVAREASEQRAQELGAALSRKEEGKRKHGDDLVELRRKLDKARKRSAGARDEQQQVATRIAELEAALVRRDADLRTLREALAHAEARVAPSAAPAPKALAAPPAPAADPAALEQLRGERDRLAKQNEELRARARSAEAASEPLRAELEKMRSKHRTQERLYLAMRGELDAKKDRLRAQAEQLERLQALKVAWGAADEESAGAGAPVEFAGQPADVDPLA